MVSIITPSYNSSCFIEQAIESVLNQTYSDLEMIIVDDCSKDKSCEIIEKYTIKDERIKLIRLNKNVGAAEARNIALRMARGRYIAFLDSDDMWISLKLEKQLKFMSEVEASFVFSQYERISEDGQKKLNTIKVPMQINYNGFLRNTIIGTLTVLIDKKKTGYFEMPNIKSSHDMALWCLLLKKGISAYGQQESLALYRVVSTSNTSKKWKAAKDVWKVYREIEKLGFLFSLYNFILYVIHAIIKRMV
jgi:teichuronic acid biosynthesis glycosyltransferase TuaG